MQEVNPPGFPQASVSKPNILRSFSKGPSKSTILMILGSFVIVLVGVASGWFLSGGTLAGRKTGQEVRMSTGTKTEFGKIDDGENITEAEGILRRGGIDGEGTHHLEREGGPSQTVYLTSTTIDLQSLVDKKVHIWGETLSAIKAPWLMDVVKVKVIE